MAEDPKAGSGINYQVDSFSLKERAKRAKEKAKEKARGGLIEGKISDKQKKQSIYAGPETPMMKTKKAQTLATSADKPKEIIQSKKMSTGSASQLSKQSRLKNLMDKAVYAANKLKKK